MTTETHTLTEAEAAATIERHGYLVRSPAAAPARRTLDQALADARGMITREDEVVIVWKPYAVVVGAKGKPVELPAAGLVQRARDVMAGVGG